VIPPDVAVELAENTGATALSPREMQVPRGVARGDANREIAEQLHTEDTVKDHMKSILSKLDAKTVHTR
jgi:two-component system NarL family response regulator